ncbi:putative ribonuclease H-like domain-containing protein, partial [Tanacetum coccineum]
AMKMVVYAKEVDLMIKKGLIAVLKILILLGQKLAFDGAYDDKDVGVEADLNNLDTTMNVSPIPTTRIDKDHPKDQIIGDLNSTIQTRRLTKISDEHVIQALEDPSWVKAMQEELLQFKLQKVWTLVNLPKGKRSIGTKWVFRNKKDKRGIIVRNKARLMDVKSAFLYGSIEEEVYVCQPPGFEDPQFLDKVYKVEKLYMVYINLLKLGQRFDAQEIPDEFYRELTFFLGLQVQQNKDEIFISQDKYVADILKIFYFATVKTASTPMEPNKALVKDEEVDSVDVLLYRSMIGSLMYLTASSPDIMFVVCACARDSPFDLEAFFDSDYGGASLDRKSTIEGYQFLDKRLISWQCKKQTIVVNFATEAEYVAAANCCGQNLVFHSKTKHIEIRHHFIRDCYEKKLIQEIKIHTDHNVADLLMKAFDVSRELGDIIERAATTASSLEVEQDSGNINRTQSMATLIEPSP